MLGLILAAEGAARGGPPPQPWMIFFSILMVLLILLRNYAGPRRRVGIPAPTKAEAAAAPELPAQYVDLLDRDRPTAVFLVGSRSEVGPYLLKPFSEQYGQVYRQVLFLAVGQLPAGLPQSEPEARKDFHRTTVTKRLRIHVRLALDPYVAAAQERGLRSDCRIALSLNPAREMCKLADGVVRTYPRVMFFVGKVVAARIPWYQRFLPARPEDGLRESLERRGIPVTVLPVVIQDSLPVRATRDFLSA